MASREQLLSRLQNDVFDVLVIGGGATGAGIVLDAASRGLKAALIESKDFASGTSSRSTKLFHGGMRYLELAAKHLDLSQYKLVKQALHERGVLLKLAPHLAHPLPIVIPVYSYWEALYMSLGVKLYDKMSGKLSIGKSSWLSYTAMQKLFPLLNCAHLKGGVLFYDGQFNDSRMNLSIILTAINFGASAVNYVKLKGFEKKNGKIMEAQVQDCLSGKNWNIQAKTIINATGPCADEVRGLDDSAAPPLIATSRGTHIVLDKSILPDKMGLLIHKTEDGRVVFLLPWQGHVLVGTTDIATKKTGEPQPSKEEVHYLLNHLRKYLELQITEKDIKSSWAGLRPLLKSADDLPSALRLRDYKVDISASGLVSVVGGKWTSYRKMAETAVDAIVLQKQFEKVAPCKTESIVLVGGENFNPVFVQNIKTTCRLDKDIIDHLLESYGDRTEIVYEIAMNGHYKRLNANYPYIEAEVVYACRYEYAVKPEDVLFRRIPLAVLDQKAALEVLSLVVDIMGKEFKWDSETSSNLLREAFQSLSWISSKETTGASG